LQVALVLAAIRQIAAAVLDAGQRIMKNDCSDLHPGVNLSYESTERTPFRGLGGLSDGNSDYGGGFRGPSNERHCVIMVISFYKAQASFICFPSSFNLE
jgi:hypothetical protein